MEITGLDFVLINLLSYVAGVATGLIICCKNKDKLLVKSRSLENLSLQQQQQQMDLPPAQVPYSTPPIVASAPVEKPVKITVE
tara:strand:+ start:236 stop:484 length:249 start_codon:yes stop_codon:yes gene_type:complete